jgi:hypothetical protein
VTKSPEPIAVYLEVGKKRTLAGAVDWPGWCRGGRDEGSALQALLEYAPRYALALRGTGLHFEPPKDTSAFAVVERVPGNATTDFGAPDVPPSSDSEPADDAELKRLQEIMRASWTALDSAAEAAQGKELRKGPRGGGRELEGVIEHVLGAERSYVSRLGAKLSKSKDSGEELEQRRQAILDAMGAAARGEFPPAGPRGGARWSPRFFVRRAAWHVLDHAWEIEDRVL